MRVAIESPRTSSGLIVRDFNGGFVVEVVGRDVSVIECSPSSSSGIVDPISLRS